MAIVSALNGIREEIAVRIAEVETDNTDQYTNWVNLCFRDVELDFPDAPFFHTSADRTLSAGTRIYTNLPTTFSKMHSITHPAGRTKLEFVSPEEFDIITASATEGGNPTIYTLRGALNNARIEFFPVPGSAITVHYDYFKQAETVSAGSATSGQIDLPFKYYELPILYGEMMGLRRQGRRAEADTVELKYQQYKSKMMNDLREQAIQIKRIKSIREFQAANRSFDDPVVNVYWGNRNL